MEEKWSIEKLNGSNWNTWKFQMKHLLMTKGLWSLIDGSEVLASEASAAAEALFQSRLHKAFSTIVLAIDSAQLYLVTSCEDPKQAWNALKNHFERETGGGSLCWQSDRNFADGQWWRVFVICISKLSEGERN